MITLELQLVKVLCILSATAFLIVNCEHETEVEEDYSDLWLGAEDDENNDVFTTGDGGDGEDDYNHNQVHENVRKSSRQDQEDVEIFLNPGPMLAPSILRDNFVNSRITLSNIDEKDLSKPSTSSKVNEEMESIMSNSLDTEPMMSDDAFSLDLNEMMFNSSTFSATSSSSMVNETKSVEMACKKKYDGAMGAFKMNFDEDCIIEITAPTPESRLILTCSPIALSDCSKQKDALAINVVGDVGFRQNSFLYCGQDANIRAISLRNKMAIRIKKAAEIVGSTFCTFHSRKYREIYSTPGSVQCGRLGRAGKIIGGRRVPPGLFPWAAQLDITRTDGSQTGCTGSIVSPLYILTAAHCMKRAESVSAFVGGTDRLDIIGTEVLIQAEKYILHKKWSSRTLVADIALVKLTQPIQYTEDISPVCLPEGRLLSDDLSGRRGVAIGWGRTETKKKAPRRLYRVKLPMLSDTKCRKIYRRFYIPKVMICTDSQKDAAICYGMKRNSAKI